MQDPHSMVKAGLLETPIPSRSNTTPIDTTSITRCLSVQRIVGPSSVTSTERTNGNEPFQGNRKVTYPVLETYKTTGTRDRLQVRHTYGDGVPIVLCVRESRIHGEGAQGVFIS